MARGSGTSLSGGAVPIEDGIVIALNRLNRILRLDPAARLAVVEPGVINLDVTAAAAPHGLYYAPDPSSQSICTIGGNVAFNSGGAHCFRHGMTANHVLGLKVVLPDATVVELGGESVEHVGPDLAGLFVGSRGALRDRARDHAAAAAAARVLSHAACRLRLAAGGGRCGVPDRRRGPAARRDGNHGPARHRRRRSRGGRRLPAGRRRDPARRTRRRSRRSRGRVRAADALIDGVGRDQHAHRQRRRRSRAHLEGPQVRVLRRRPHQPRLHRAGRRGPAHAARRGARRDRGARRRRTACASPTCFMPATATCTR